MPIHFKRIPFDGWSREKQCGDRNTGERMTDDLEDNEHNNSDDYNDNEHNNNKNNRKQWKTRKGS